MVFTIDVIKASPWTRTFARKATAPAFSPLPTGLRPYLLATLLFATVNAALYADDAALIHFGLPWPLISVLVVAATASLWGVRPAVLTLVLSALYGLTVVPHLAPISVSRNASFWQVILMRNALYIACGAATIYLTHRARLMQEKAEIRHGVVTTLQSMILPGELAAAPNYDLSSVYRPARHEEQVGGDFYDFYPISEGVYGVLIGDVMGKGKEAAVSTALLRYSIRAFTSAGMKPAEAVCALNRLIDTQEDRFEMASLFLGFLDTKSQSLRYANAGHEAPLLVRARGDEEELEATGPLLGTRLDVGYGEKVVNLGARDMLLLMTDGVTEARNDQKQFLGKEGISQLLYVAQNAATCKEVLTTIDISLTAYIGANRCDDIAMLLLRGLPG